MFVGGLPKATTDDDLKTYFSKFGELDDYVVMIDRDSQKPRGFGFVTYKSEESVKEVLQNYDHHTIRNKWVECKLATPKDSDELVNSPSSVHSSMSFKSETSLIQSPDLSPMKEKQIELSFNAESPDLKEEEKESQSTQDTSFQPSGQPPDFSGQTFESDFLS